MLFLRHVICGKYGEIRSCGCSKNKTMWFVICVFYVKYISNQLKISFSLKNVETDFFSMLKSNKSTKIIKIWKTATSFGKLQPQFTSDYLP